MTTKIGINGFGRIGRLAFKAIHECHGKALDVAVVNDLTDSHTNAHLFKYDTNYGVYQGTVAHTDDSIIVDGKSTKVVAERDPAKIPWKDHGVQIVIESTGLFTDATKAAGHLRGGAKKVIISAPANNEDITIVMGVNHMDYDSSKHNVLSNASCTTNGIAPLAKVLQDNFGVSKGLMSTIHSYTNDQKIMDTVHKDLRRARTAAMNIIPTTTGAAYAVTRVIPSLEGKIHGMAFRIPVSAVSLVDFVVDLEKEVTGDQVNQAFRKASQGELKGILEYTDEPLVSSD
ncbi:MAG: type I glyceraldehyde-3-phosphate dehydrogenase, partial [Dehalococcoidia bacterium]|nr:type I glyceraldehyde-3-phosphate dehydrogenase [Dehalococcoidia bacterium]